MSQLLVSDKNQLIIESTTSRALIKVNDTHLKYLRKWVSCPLSRLSTLIS